MLNLTKEPPIKNVNHNFETLQIAQVPGHTSTPTEVDIVLPTEARHIKISERTNLTSLMLDTNQTERC